MFLKINRKIKLDQNLILPTAPPQLEKNSKNRVIEQGNF